MRSRESRTPFFPPFHRRFFIETRPEYYDTNRLNQTFVLREYFATFFLSIEIRICRIIISEIHFYTLFSRSERHKRGE